MFRLSKTYSINPSLKNTLRLYVFESLRQVTKILFDKSELNFESLTWSSLGSGRINLDIWSKLRQESVDQRGKKEMKGTIKPYEAIQYIRR